MKKADLKNKMVVELEMGKKYIVVDDVMVGKDGFINLDNYNDDLKVKDIALQGKERYNIKKVFTIQCYLNHIESYNLSLLWERQWKPEIGETFYYVDLTVRDKVRCTKWGDYDYENRILDRGLAFKTKEEAIEMAQKMLKLTKEV